MFTKHSIPRASASVLMCLVACSAANDTPRRSVDERLARAAEGTWELTLRLNRPMSLSMNAATLPRTAAGTISLLEVHSRTESPALDGITHVGVYDLDVSALELPARDAALMPGVIARVVRSNASGARDSIYAVLDPGIDRPSLTLTGAWSHDSVSGEWSTRELPGGGSFTLRRRAMNATGP